MKLNWAERWIVSSPLQVIKQNFMIRRMKEILPIPEEARILDVGCGRGSAAHLINEFFRPALLCALDLDVKMVLKAKTYLSHRNQNGVSLSVGNVLRLPFKDNGLDVVFGFGVLHHVVDWRSAVKEIARVLKTGGLYFIEEYYPSLYQNIITKHIVLHPTEDRFFSQDLREALKSTGIPLHKAREVKKAGILGVAIKQ
jgi:ubiquinone/menaquinone biosynthesis C-methylase UbiE